MRPKVKSSAATIAGEGEAMAVAPEPSWLMGVRVKGATVVSDVLDEPRERK